MKKSLPIILLSVFTLAFSAFGFLGIQPVKATTEIDGITINEADVGYEGVSLTYAEQQEIADGVMGSGDGKMKFYSSLTQDLYTSLTDKDYKTGTLIIPAELLTGASIEEQYESLKIDKVGGENGAINVDTTLCWTLYDVDDDGEELDADDEYWAMASLYNIPRAYYGVEMVARPYLAIKEAGANDYTYVYATADGITKFYSLATTALGKLEEGDFDDKEELKTAITEDYTKFNVTFHFAPLSEMNKDFVNDYNQIPYQESRTFKVSYGGILPSISAVYSGTYYMNYDETQYTKRKGFYNADRTAFVIQMGGAMAESDISVEDGGSADASFDYYTKTNYTFLTKVYGDMNLYEEEAPSNLIDDFSTAQSVTAAYGRSVDSNTGKYTYAKRYEHTNATWYSEYTAVDYKTGENVTESGVLAVSSQFVTNAIKEGGVATGKYEPATGSHYFHFTSSIRNNSFWRNSYSSGKKVDITEEDFYTNANTKSDYDYINYRVLVATTLPGVETVALSGLYGFGNYANQNPTKVPVNQWVNIRIERGQTERVSSSYGVAAYRDNNTSDTTVLQITSSGNEQKVEGAFTLLIDYFAYERDMRIGVNGQTGYRTIANTHAHKDVNVYSVRYDKVSTPVGDQVELSTVLTNGTINYTVIDPDGQPVVLTDGNKFVPTKLGDYTVKATCNDYVLQANTRSLFKAVSKQYGELVFEVRARNVTPTLKNAEGTAIDLTQSFNIGNPVTIDFAVEGVDTILPENAVYEVKYLLNDSSVTVTDGKFTPLNAGDYSVVVKYTDANGYQSVSNAVILKTIGRVVTPSFSIGGNVIDLNEAVIMDSVVTISATVEGLDDVVAENFSYKVIKLDSNEAKNYEFEVGVDGQFVAGFAGTYNIIVYYQEGEVVHASETFVMTAKTEVGYFNDFSDSDTIRAAYRIDADSKSYKSDYSDTGIARGMLADGETEWKPEYHNVVEDQYGEIRYGVISTRPQPRTTEWGTGALGINLRSYKYRDSTAWATAGLTKLINGNTTNTSSREYQSRMINAGKWDYISIPIYIPKKDAQKDETISVRAVYSVHTWNVPYNTWYELRFSKQRAVFNLASSSLINVFNNNSSNSPIIFLASSKTAGAYTTNMYQEVYFDSMSFEVDETYTDFESFDIEVDGTTKLNADTGIVNFYHYKPAEGQTKYTGIPMTFTITNAKAGGKDIDPSKIKGVSLITDGHGSYTYKKVTEDGEVAGTSSDFNKLIVNSVLNGSALGKNQSCIAIRFTYVDDSDPENVKTYRAYKCIVFNVGTSYLKDLPTA